MPERQGGKDPRRQTRRERPPPGGINVDLGIGGLFKGLGDFLDLVGQMADSGQSEVNRSGEVHGPGAVRGVYGFSVRMNVGESPVVEHFGNIHSTERGPEVSEIREPLVDIFDEGDHILVVAELPGVTEGEIRIQAAEDVLTIEATGRDRKYAKDVQLPSAIDPAGLRQSYQNGILEVRLSKAEHT